LPAKLRVFGNFGPLLLMLVFAAADYSTGNRNGLEEKGVMWSIRASFALQESPPAFVSTSLLLCCYREGVSVIGPIPSGLAPHKSFFSSLGTEFSSLLASAVGISIVSFMETISMAKQGDDSQCTTHTGILCQTRISSFLSESQVLQRQRPGLLTRNDGVGVHELHDVRVSRLPCRRCGGIALCLSAFIRAVRR
jgi:hypothetical protein